MRIPLDCGVYWMLAVLGLPMAGTLTWSAGSKTFTRRLGPTDFMPDCARFVRHVSSGCQAHESPGGGLGHQVGIASRFAQQDDEAFLFS